MRRRPGAAIGRAINHNLVAHGIFSEAVAETGGGAKLNVAFPWQLAATVTLRYRNVSLRVSLAIKQNKQTEETRRGRGPE